MLARELITALLPDEGWYALGVITPETEKFRTLFFDDLELLFSEADRFNGSGEDVYVSPFTFASKSRKASNAVKTKLFFMDLDVGEEVHKFQSKKEAAKELQRFLSETGLPIPTIIDSGGGVHVYWKLSKYLGMKEWFALATRLKKLCHKFKFRADHAVTSDAARVLRCIGSMNHKRNAESKIVHESASIELEEVSAVLDLHSPEESWLKSAKKEWMNTSNLAGADLDPNVEFKFHKIFKLAVSHDQCAQLLHCIDKPENTSEPLWRAALSIAWHCSDSEQAIQVLSKGHPEYDSDKTIAKAMGTQGKPYRCETFDQISPGLCEHCPNHDKINSPISLGKILKRSVQTSAAPSKSTSVSTHNVQVVIPTTLPFPFFRPAMGGIAIDTEDKKGVPKQVILTSSDVWVDNLVQDSRKDYRVSLCINHPQDGFISCAANFAELSSKDSAIKFLANKGVSIDPAHKETFMQYIHKIIKNLQTNKPSLMARDSFGWTPQDTFVLGEIEHTPASRGGYMMAAASAQTEELRSLYMPSGSYSAWRKAIRLYERDEQSLSSFRYGVLYSQFGAPLMKFSAQNAVVNSMLGVSGVGKSTAQLIGMSVYCSRTAKIQGNSTMNAIFNRIGVLSNLPFVIDEFSDEDAKKQSAITLNITSGSGKDRMDGNTNTERLNTIKWSSQGTLSTNQSIHTMMADKPQNLMRVFEFHCRPTRSVTAQEVDYLYRTAGENYGWAGFIYAQFLVNHVSGLQAAVEVIQAAVIKAFNMKQEERFWTAGIATNLIGAAIAKKLGIFNAPLVKDIQWIRSTIATLRAGVKESSESNSDPIGLYLQQYARNIIRVTLDMQGKKIVVDADRIQTPIMGRFDMESKVLWIPKRDLKLFASVNYTAADALRKYSTTEDVGLLDGVIKGLDAPLVKCYRIEVNDPSVGEKLQMANVADADPPEA